MKSERDLRFDYFYKEYYTRLKYVALRIVKNEADAEDMVQEAMIRFLNYTGEVYDERRFLFTLIKQVSLNFVNLERLPQTTLVYEPLEDNNLEYLLTRATVIHHIIKISTRLPKKCKEIFDMMYLRGMEYPEVVQATGMNINTLRNQHKRLVSLIQGYFKVEHSPRKHKWTPELLKKINELSERMTRKKACSMMGVRVSEYFYYNRDGHFRRKKIAK